MTDTQRDAAAGAQLPFMPLREVVMFPRSIMPLFVGREASIKAIEAAQATTTKRFFWWPSANPTWKNPPPKTWPRGRGLQGAADAAPADGTIKVLFEGLFRAQWSGLAETEACATVMVRRRAEIQSRPEEAEALVRAAHEALEEYGKTNKKISQEAVLSIMALHEPGPLADAILPHLKVDYRKKQEALELDDVTLRLESAYALLQGEVALATVEKRIKNRVKVQMERNQREYYLNEQIKAINKEMGREDDPQAEVDEIEQKLKARRMPEEARQKALAEAKNCAPCLPPPRNTRWCATMWTGFWTCPGTNLKILT